MCFTYNITKKLVSVCDIVKVFLMFVGGILEVPYPEFLLIVVSWEMNFAIETNTMCGENSS